MKWRVFLIVFCAAAFQVTTASAQPSPADALNLKPMQEDVDFDRPVSAKDCRVTAEEASDGHTAWVVRGPAGELLRQFVDSNGDNKVDQWRYFKSGIEVYRDIDADFNGKADQYRWLGTAGTRWGLDKDEDGSIDAWKSISAEEVTSELIEAVKTKDKRRFENILLSGSELQDLGVGKKLNAAIAERIDAARQNFDRTARTQQKLASSTDWIDFGGLRPGTIPAGTDGSTRDVTVYENVVAMVEDDGKPAQIPVGTMVQLPAGWRLIDLPLGSDGAPQFIFFDGANPSLDATVGISEETQELITQLEKIDDELAQARSPSDLSKLNQQRADTLEKLAKAARRTADREMWWMQFADTVGTATQSGDFPEGTRRLEQLKRNLERDSKNQELLAHVTFTHMSAAYAERLQQDDEDFGAVQKAWLEQLEAFIERYPNSEDTPEAMLQLAMTQEFAGEEEDANRWYTRIVKDFSSSPLAAKAAGAKRRLESIGRSWSLSGRTVTGKQFDLKRLRGNIVLVHYWATWCDPCKEDMALIANLKQELRGEKFEVVGINLDAQPDELRSYLRENPPKWTHLYEEGGLDSRLASEMGVFTLPVMLLVDERGRIVNRRLHGAQLAEEVRKLLK